MKTSLEGLKVLHSERFEVAFNRIHDSLKKLAKKNSTDQFTHLLRLSSHHRIIQAFQDDLFQYAKLRNALVHEKKSIGHYIAEPHHEVVLKIERMANLLEMPNYALTIASKEVIYLETVEKLDEVIRKMKRFPYAQYPVYNGRKCVGLLTTRGIVNWMADHMTRSFVDLSDITISDIFEYEQNHPITFASKALNILEAEDIYKEFHQHKRDLEMIIITENGRNDETPLGVITAWDLIEVDYVMDVEGD
ncbi:CBS domain-containing protein [Rossellomorea aquimaris]|uniref:CBS domain-containing protein n=1 Tax=Rossellomorea aquimaris TaxID=189382 RepID=UPI001CD708A9|nr:CBS domain-containing protein [Rossellomorea aquimaris]MCA1060828.1 CBS domain-containing protein [Rossellomorea aquimaris]